MNRFGFIAEGFKGFFRNGVRSAASVIILGSSLLLVGIFTTLIAVINQSIENIDDFNEIVVYMNLEATADTVNAAGDSIRALKNVRNVVYVPKADALAAERDKFGEDYAYIFDSYDDTTNPLPDSFKIEYESVDDIDALVYNLGHIEGVNKVKNRYDIAKNIQNFKSAISLGGAWLMALLVAVSVFVISNTIRLTYHAREMEISVMRYIGATKGYITLPFVFEGAITGCLAATFGYVIQYYLYKLPLAELAEKFGGFITVPNFDTLNPYYLAIYFGAGLFLGIIGSAFAIRKYLKA